VTDTEKTERERRSGTSELFKGTKYRPTIFIIYIYPVFVLAVACFRCKVRHAATFLIHVKF